MISTSVTASTKPYINFEKLADAIYWAEGGRKARVPYGILSVPVSGHRDARRICINTVRNSYRRWDGSGRFIVHLSNTYCPRSVSKKGNDNWNKNVRHYYFNPKQIPAQ